MFYYIFSCNSDTKSQTTAAYCIFIVYYYILLLYIYHIVHWTLTYLRYHHMLLIKYLNFGHFLQ